MQAAGSGEYGCFPPSIEQINLIIIKQLKYRLQVGIIVLVYCMSETDMSLEAIE